MSVDIVRLHNKNQTGKEMHRLISKYSSDLDNVKLRRGNQLVPFSFLPMDEAFNFVKNIPYRRDLKPIEVVARPGKIMLNRGVGMDCKKKAILLASYFRQRGIPWRLIASSRLPSGRIHHVFPQMCFCGTWLNFDATYPHYVPFARKGNITRAEVLQP